MILAPSKMLHKIADIKDLTNSGLMQYCKRLRKNERKKVEKLQEQFNDELRLALCKYCDLYNHVSNGGDE